MESQMYVESLYKPSGCELFSFTSLNSFDDLKIFNTLKYLKPLIAWAF